MVRSSRRAHLRFSAHGVDAPVIRSTRSAKGRGMGSRRQACQRFLYRPGPRAGAVANVARIGLRRTRRSNGNRHLIVLVLVVVLE